MRYYIPALIGLATAAVAQNSTTDCTTAFSDCYVFGSGNGNVCSSQASTCKDKCATQNSNCLSSGTSKEVCQTRYSQCIGATSSSVVSINCIASVIPCYTGDGSKDNTCDSHLGECKTSCSALLDLCESAGNDSSKVCQSKYSDCLGASNVTVPSTSCLKSAEQCYKDGSEYNLCSSNTATCKQTCGVLNDACMTSQDTSECQSSYEKCLGSGQLSESSIHCVAEVEALIKDGKNDQDIEAHNAQCKDLCARGYDTCNSAHDSANNATCLSWYSSCLGAKDLPTLTSNCVSSSESSYLNATSGDNVQDSDLATCKSQCGYMYSTCLASGDESVKDDCLSFYSQCTSGSNTTTSEVDCVAANEKCYLDGSKSDAQCDMENAQCKNLCTRTMSTCTSSGDKSITDQCVSRYESCLGSSKLQESEVNCVARNDACYLSGQFTDAECDAKAAVCKTVCSRSQDTCLSSNQSSVVTGCNAHYEQCLGSTDVTPVSPISCVEVATKCFLDGTADNDCAAIVAQCKSSCSRSQDTCLSSGNPAVKPACMAHYSTCLGATPEAEEAARDINCIQRYTTCTSSGIASNTCGSQAAQCKNTCSGLLDACNSSGSNSTGAQCQGIYNACLGSLVTSLVEYKPLDCAGKQKVCASNGTASNVCDMKNADCRNACSVTLDLCLVSGSSDTAACNHLYMMCQDANSYKVTSIPASLKPTVSLSSLPTSANVTSFAAGTGAVSTGGAFVSGPYNNGSSTAGAQTGAAPVSTKTGSASIPGAQSGFVSTKSGSAVSTAGAQSDAVSASVKTESTVYVTDVVKTTVTTCPVGQTITSAGSTTVLTAPSVMTTSLTVKSTVTAVNTITVPAAGNNAVPSSKASPSVESTVYVTDVVKETVTTCPAGETVTASGKTSVLTAPSVITSQITVKSTITSAVTHTAVASQSSPVNAQQTSPASVAGHVAVPSTVTLYSTQEVTVTSCSPDVTNCPAKVSTTVFPTAITVSSVWSRTQPSSAASSPAGSAPVGSAPAGSSPAGSSPVSPESTSPVTIASTMFYYSTAVVTLTSSRSTVVQTSVVPTAYSVTSVLSSAFTPIEYTSSVSGVPQNSAPVVSAPVSSAPVVPTTAPFAVTNSTLLSVGGTGVVGTGSGSKATSTYSPSQYTGAANKAGVAGLAGVAAFAAFLL